MAKLNHSATLSIGGRVAGTWAASVGAIRQGASSIKKEIGGLKTEQQKVSNELRATQAAAARMGIEGSESVAALTREHKKLKGQQVAVEAELKKAQREAVKLGKAGSEAVDHLTFKLEQLEREERKVTHYLDDARKAAAKLGVEGSKDVAKLAKAHADLGSKIEQGGRKLKSIKAWHELEVGGRVSDALTSLGSTAWDATSMVASGLWNVAKSAALAGTAVVATGAALAGWFTKSSLEAAASQEQLFTSLVTTQGGSAQAEKAMQWITKFAADTPYEMDLVGEAFNNLSANSITPTNGTLKILGDTASSLSKPLMAPVEALKDAMQGENERLKEFGITAKKAGGFITYFYTNTAGKEVKERVRATSKELIRTTVLGIWNEKYADAMKRQSKTWTGLMSNLKDHWTQFQVRVMKSGVFDHLKGKAEQLLERVNVWAEDGTLDRWARDIGKAYEWTFDRIGEGFTWAKGKLEEWKADGSIDRWANETRKAALWAFEKLKEGATWVRDNWPQIKENFLAGAEAAKSVASWIYRVGKYLSDTVGGPENLAKGLALLGAAKVLSPLGSLVSVGWSIVSWLVRARLEAKGLEGDLGGVGGKGPGKLSMGERLGRGVTDARTGFNGARAGVNALVAGTPLAGSVAGASGLAIGGTVLAGGALGYATGTLIDKGIEGAFGKSASTWLGEVASGDVDRQRAALLADTGSHRSAGRSGGQTTTVHDSRQYTFQIEAKGPDAQQVASEVERRLQQSLRDRGSSSYGGFR